MTQEAQANAEMRNGDITYGEFEKRVDGESAHQDSLRATDGPDLFPLDDQINNCCTTDVEHFVPRDTFTREAAPCR